MLAQADGQEENNSGDSTAEDNESISTHEVHKRVQEFVMKLIPNADLIRDFNGSFIYLIPVGKGNDGTNHRFNPQKIYQMFEANKQRLYIQDWGLCQSSLEDVFTKICEQNGDNNA